MDEKKSQRTYIVTAEVVVSVHTEVLASSEAEALEIAESRDVQGLCHFCASSRGGKDKKEFRLSDGLDCSSPENLKAELEE